MLYKATLQCSYLLVIFFQVCQFLAERFTPNLQVGCAKGQLIHHSVQPTDVCLNTLVQSKLVFIPER